MNRKIEVANISVDGVGSRHVSACFGCAVRTCCPIRRGIHEMNPESFVVMHCDYHVRPVPFKKK